MNAYLLMLGGIVLFMGGCSHVSSAAHEEPTAARAARTYADEPEEGVRAKGSTAATRILVLINNGQFAEAEVLIAESLASGLITAPTAARLLDRITILNMRLGQIPATLQRVRDFPSQLKDYTLFEIKQMLERKDFTLATELQLKMVKKLIEQPDRLMGKQ